MRRGKLPRIICAKCRTLVESVDLAENVCEMQMNILASCHGQKEFMKMGASQFYQVIELGIVGVAFERKIEDHSNTGETTDEHDQRTEAIDVRKACSMEDLRNDH